MVKYYLLNIQYYNDEPKPEYEPQINKLMIAITAKPPTRPTSHKGILPVFAIKKLLLD